MENKIRWQKLLAQLRPQRERPYWLAFNFFEGIGPQRFRQLLAFFGSAAKAWSAKEKALMKAGLKGKALAKFKEFRRYWHFDFCQLKGQQFSCRRQFYRDFRRWLANHQREQQWGWVSRYHAYGQGETASGWLLTWMDANYPPGLRLLISSPPLLYYRGRADFLSQEIWQNPWVAIVGSRKVSAYGQQVTRRLAQDLAARGVGIISGMARGVDSLAHQAALDQRGATVAVLGTGIEVVYPRENQQLYQQLWQRGGLLTEFPPGFPPLPGNFPARNRLIAGLSQLVIVTEAAQKSGSLITAKLAAEQGKDVLAVPGPITSALSQGTSFLLKQGAKLITGVDDVLEELKISPLPAKAAPKLTAAEAKVWQALADGHHYLDELVRLSGLPAAQLGSILSIMALKDLVVDLGGGLWGRKQ